MNARLLFGSAAAFNFAVGLSMVFAYPFTARLLDVAGPPTVWFHLAAATVLVFGYAYAQIARDPVRNRPYVVLGILGKSAFVVAIYAHFLAGDASPRLAALVTVDLFFALLFAAFLRATPR